MMRRLKLNIQVQKSAPLGSVWFWCSTLITFSMCLSFIRWFSTWPLIHEGILELLMSGISPWSFLPLWISQSHVWAGDVLWNCTSLFQEDKRFYLFRLFYKEKLFPLQVNHVQIVHVLIEFLHGAKHLLIRSNAALHYQMCLPVLAVEASFQTRIVRLL